nr:MAG TPA: hypothetical protein [Caudoviricetes sp.]
MLRSTRSGVVAAYLFRDISLNHCSNATNNRFDRVHSTRSGRGSNPLMATSLKSCN